MNHRGACACDNDTGDGAGVLCAIPHDYYANEIRWGERRALRRAANLVRSRNQIRPLVGTRIYRVLDVFISYRIESHLRAECTHLALNTAPSDSERLTRATPKIQCETQSSIENRAIALSFDVHGSLIRETLYFGNIKNSDKTLMFPKVKFTNVFLIVCINCKYNTIRDIKLSKWHHINNIVLNNITYKTLLIFIKNVM